CTCLAHQSDARSRRAVGDGCWRPAHPHRATRTARQLKLTRRIAAPPRQTVPRRSRSRALRLQPVLTAGLLVAAACAPAAATPDGQAATPQSPGAASTGVALMGLLTVITLTPALLMMVTSFTRIVVVLSLLRNAIGVPQLPPNQILLGLALFLTVFVMAPQWQAINRDALQPYLRGEIVEGEAFNRGQQPIRAFMLRQTREQDLALFVRLSGTARPNTVDDVPTYVVIPAFIISELKTAFQMGFILFV